MKARVKATGQIIEVISYSGFDDYDYYEPDTKLPWLKSQLEFDVTDKEENYNAGMAMQGLLSSGKLNIIMDNSDVLPEGIAIVSRDFAHALVKKVRYEENPKELEGLKRELEALNIEKTILENKVKLLKEERK